MTRKTARRLATVTALTGASLTLALPASAHNAGHVFLPSGECLAIGSFRDAPLVGSDRHTLDLVPETPTVPFDEYGVSFVGFEGQTPIAPGPCPA
jgi:hypothetical protein